MARQTPLITISEARSRILATATPLPAETVPVVDALDRVLAREVRVEGDVPPFACSAMDGYAILAGPAGRRMNVVDESRAGAPARARVSGDEAIRISTGAAIPDGATAVVRQEDVELQADGAILLGAPVAPGENVRNAGEDMRAGTTILSAGTFVSAPALGAAISAGAGELEVRARPRVAILSTGDELREPGEPLGPGQIYNSNAPMLAALASRFAAAPPRTRRIRDHRAATEATLAEALGDADLVIVSGGVSVGPHDHVKPALATLGVSEIFWGVSLQPGKPTWFGERDGTLVFGLPGNPVSAYVTFSLFVAPALLALQGAEHDDRLQRATLAVASARNRHREQALRVRLENREGMLFATPTGPQGSHIVTSLLKADALALITPGDGEAPAGTVVQLAPLPR